ncbi:MAG: hypothetical protein ACK5OB_14950 [Pirellula sp.]
MPISVVYLLWFIPVLIAVSLIMAGTRHEKMELIFESAWRNAVWVLTFLGTVALVIAAAIWWIG